MAVDDCARPANATVDLGGIPASQNTFRSIRQVSVVDKVERQERHISMALNLGVDYLVPAIDVSDFLSIRVEHLPEIERDRLRRPA